MSRDKDLEKTWTQSTWPKRTNKFALSQDWEEHEIQIQFSAPFKYKHLFVWQVNNIQLKAFIIDLIVTLKLCKTRQKFRLVPRFFSAL